MNHVSQDTTQEQEDKPTGRPFQFVSVLWKRLFGFTVFFTLLYAITTFLIMTQAVEEATRHIQLDLTQAMEGIAADVDVALLLALAETGEINEAGLTDDPRFDELLDFLDNAHHIEPDAWPYLYIPSDNEGEIIAVVDLWALEKYTETAPFGFLEPYTSNSGFILLGLQEQTYRAADHEAVQNIKNYAAMFEDKLPFLENWLTDFADWLVLANIFPVQEFGTYDDQFGRWASGYMPLKNEAGEIVAAIGVDFKADTVLGIQHAVRDRLSSMFWGIYLSFIALNGIVGAYLTRNLGALSRGAEQIANGDYNVDLGAYANRKTKDELTELSKALAIMVKRILAREEQYRIVVAGQTDYIIRWKPDYSFSFANETYYKSVGLSKEELLDTKLTDRLTQVMNDQEIKRLIKDLKRLTPENPEIKLEVPRAATVDGIEWVQWHAAAFFDSAGNVFEYQAVGRDITHLKKLQDELKQANAHLKTLSQKMIEERESEFKNFARILHDEVLQGLSKAALMEHSDAEESSTNLDHTIETLRDLISNLRSPMLEYGLHFAIRDHIETLNNLLPQANSITLDIEPSWVRYAPEVEVHVFRLVLQAFDNIVQHAHAKNIKISGEILAEGINLFISDDGDGFEFNGEDATYWDALLTNNHFGLIGMKERAELVDATLAIRSQPGQGTVVHFSWQANPIKTLP